MHNANNSRSFTIISIVWQICFVTLPLCIFSNNNFYSDFFLLFKKGFSKEL